LEPLQLGDADREASSNIQGNGSLTLFLGLLLHSIFDLGCGFLRVDRAIIDQHVHRKSISEECHRPGIAPQYLNTLRLQTEDVPFRGSRRVGYKKQVGKA